MIVRDTSENLSIAQKQVRLLPGPPLRWPGNALPLVLRATSYNGPVVYAVGQVGFQPSEPGASPGWATSFSRIGTVSTLRGSEAESYFGETLANARNRFESCPAP